MALTKNDFKAISNTVEVVVDELLDKKLDEKLDEKIGFLPTKEEFYSKMDEIMGELKAIREIITIHGKQISRNTNRVEKLENIHPKGRHAII